MDKIVNFAFYYDKNIQGTYCTGQAYFDFLDYAFSKTDCFMLVYINYYGKGYTEEQKYFKDALKKFKIKSRKNPSWPGTPGMECLNTTYNVVFYKNTEEAKNILKEVDDISYWEWGCAEDLAFFKGDQCWFYSVGHEAIASVIHADKEDIEFLISKGLSKKECVHEYDSFYDAYDEPGLGEKLNRFKAK